MARVTLEIDRLIDEGLTRYGAGDLDGALAAWEEALALDPQQERAQSYLDYVKNNYDLLASEVRAQEEAPPFAITDEDGGYQIEVSTGELAATTAKPRDDDPLDGWAIEEDRPIGTPSERELTFQLEIEETDDPGDVPLESYPPRPSRPSGDAVNFEEATREYTGGPPRIAQPPPTDESLSQEFRIEITPTPSFDEYTPGFGSSTDLKTPAGFNTQITDVRPHDLGFVQVKQPPAIATGTVLGAGAAAEAAISGPGAAPDPDAEPTTPHMVEGPPIEHGPPRPPPGEPLSEPSIELSYEIDSPTIERSPLGPGEPLTTPRYDERGRIKPATTRDLPGVTRRPGPSSDHPVTPSNLRDFPLIPQPRPGIDPPRRPETRDFDTPTERKPLRPSPPIDPLVPPSLRDLAEPVTSRMPRTSTRPGTLPPPSETKPPARVGKPPLVSIPLPADAPPPPPIVTAPTRDLGLRQTQPAPGGPFAFGSTQFEDPNRNNEDDPTGETELHVLQRAATLPSPQDPTRNDIVLPFDPIGARSAQILQSIDEGAPADEPREDQVRRRITALFERAVAWNKAGELDRAVAAIDLALSEDPNSALAQKLIHRHRETMMTVFQAFLGDLERTPVLARPLHELAAAPISSRAAFLLSRVDGLLSIDEILDVSGMPRLEAYRYLCQLFLRGILR